MFEIDPLCEDPLIKKKIEENAKSRIVKLNG
jgi:hypothetical protein